MIMILLYVGRSVLHLLEMQYLTIGNIGEEHDSKANLLVSTLIRLTRDGSIDCSATWLVDTAEYCIDTSSFLYGKPSNRRNILLLLFLFLSFPSSAPTYIASDGYLVNLSMNPVSNSKVKIKYQKTIFDTAPLKPLGLKAVISAVSIA